MICNKYLPDACIGHCVGTHRMTRTRATLLFVSRYVGKLEIQLTHNYKICKHKRTIIIRQKTLDRQHSYYPK